VYWVQREQYEKKHPSPVDEPKWAEPSEGMKAAEQRINAPGEEDLSPIEEFRPKDIEAPERTFGVSIDESQRRQLESLKAKRERKKGCTANK
jgi:hypothetical protein